MKDQLILDALSSSSVFFVQVGANDGVAGDQIHELIMEHGWRGILVEPVKHIFERLQQTYSDPQRFILCNVAISEEPATFYYVSEKASKRGFPYWHDQLGSFHRNHILKHLDGQLEPYIVEEEIDCITLDQLLAEVVGIDLLAIDTEGHDYRVLSQLDFGRFHPTVILIEHAHLTRDDKASLIELFAVERYDINDLGTDYLAVAKGDG